MIEACLDLLFGCSHRHQSRSVHAEHEQPKDSGGGQRRALLHGVPSLRPRDAIFLARNASPDSSRQAPRSQRPASSSPMLRMTKELRFTRALATTIDMRLSITSTCNGCGKSKLVSGFDGSL